MHTPKAISFRLRGIKKSQHKDNGRETCSNSSYIVYNVVTTL